MNVTELEAMLDRDPLGLWLARIDVPPMSSGLPARVLAERRARRLWRPVLMRGLIVISAVVLAVAMLAATPAGATVGRAILPRGMQQRFGLVEGAPERLTPPPGAKAGTGPPMSPVPCSQIARYRPAGPNQGVPCYPDLSVAEAQRRAAFTIPTPRRLPQGLNYRGALVESPTTVYLSYQTSAAHGGLGLRIHKGTQTGGSAVPRAGVQTAAVDGSPAVYVHGSYEDSGPGTAATWNPNADADELTWEHGGLTFDLTAGSLHLSKQDMIAIAESVQ